MKSQRKLYYLDLKITEDPTAADLGAPRFTVVALDSLKHIVACASESTLKEAVTDLRSTLLDLLVEYAWDRTDPRTILKFGVPKKPAISFTSLELLPIMIRYHRRVRGWTQVEMAKRYGVVQSVYAGFERVGANLTLETIQRLSDCFSTNLIYLSDDSEGI